MALSALGELGDRQIVALLQEDFRQASTSALRQGIAVALLELGEPAGAQALEHEMQGEEGDLRLQAALLLCEHGQPAAAQRLNELMRGAEVSEELELAVHTCQARVGQSGALDWLRQRLSTARREEQKFAAAARLSVLGEPSGLRFLREMVDRHDPQQLLAARLLALAHDVSVAPLFRQVIKEAQADLSAKVVALDGLGACSASADLSELAPLLDSTTAKVLRQAAAAAALHIVLSDPRLLASQNLAWAQRMIGDSNWLVRHSAVQLLSGNEEAQALALLQQGMHDSHRQVRVRSVQLLSYSTSELALHALAAGLSHEDLAVRQATLAAVVRVAHHAYAVDTAAAPTVRKWLKHLSETGSAEQRAVARAGLLELGDKSQWGELAKQRQAASVLVRETVALASSADRQTLGALLLDTEPRVRLAAAERLARLGDRQGLAVLREFLTRSSLEALRAYAALLRMGEPVTPPTAVARLETVTDVAERMALLEAAELLPSEPALELLRQAALDSEPHVRRLTAEVVAELAPATGGTSGVAILALLSRDPAPLVRSRAEVLLKRLLEETDAEETGTALRAGYASLLQPRADSATAAEPSAGTDAKSPGTPSGTLSLAAPVPSFFQLDRRPWQRTPVRPLQLPAGVHHLLYLAGQQSVTITGGGNALAELSASPPERLAASGLQALSKNDYRGAQRLLEKSNSLCALDHKHALPCQLLSIEVSYQLGRAYEGLERWSEAMKEYQSATQHSSEVKGRVDYRAEAQAAITRLTPRLGKVQVPKIERGRCSIATLWLPPGKHEIEVGGKRVSVTVRPRAVVQAGSCPGAP